jgi:hypothetical protein
MKRFILIFRIFILGLLLVLISVGCDEVAEWAEVSKDKVVVGEPVKLSVTTREGDTFGCSKPYHERVEGKMYSWKVEPSDGATVKDGVFVASKPGKYNVTPVGILTTKPSSRAIIVEGTAAETSTTETVAAETTVFTYISLSDGVISDPINSSESDLFAKLTIEQGLVDSNGRYLLGGEESVEGCDGRLSGTYDPKTREFTGKCWVQVSIPTIHKPDEEYITNSTFSKIIDHSGEVVLTLDGTEIHNKYTYREDGTEVWTETVGRDCEVTFTVKGLD